MVITQIKVESRDRDIIYLNEVQVFFTKELLKDFSLHKIHMIAILYFELASIGGYYTLISLFRLLTCHFKRV